MSGFEYVYEETYTLNSADDLGGPLCNEETRGHSLRPLVSKAKKVHILNHFPCTLLPLLYFLPSVYSPYHSPPTKTNKKTKSFL